MLAWPSLPKWLRSMNTADAVQPSATLHGDAVTGVVDWLDTPAAGRPTPVATAVAVNAEPRYAYGPGSHVTVTVAGAGETMIGTDPPNVT